MTGRGVDQILPRPSSPELREDYVASAMTYVELAEALNGRIPRGVDPAYIWGDALAQFREVRPAACIVNLETSVTVSDEFWPEKAVHYRMHPENVACLRAARIDLCVLSNNHVLDFGRPGLSETLRTLRANRILTVGAGRDLDEARKPIRLRVGHNATILVFGLGSMSSGIPADWAAGPGRSGVNLVSEFSAAAAEDVVNRIQRHKQPGELVVVSIHWGSNWGYEVPEEQRAFARALVRGGADIVHGHSSHHVRPIEIYDGKLIIYGAGDLINDYEGIGGYEDWRGDLGALYFATCSVHDGTLRSLRIAPMHLNKMRLARASIADLRWFERRLNQISRSFGAGFVIDDGGFLVLAGRRPSYEDRSARIT